MVGRETVRAGRRARKKAGKRIFGYGSLGLVVDLGRKLVDSRTGLWKAW